MTIRFTCLIFILASATCFAMPADGNYAKTGALQFVSTDNSSGLQLMPSRAFIINNLHGDHAPLQESDNDTHLDTASDVTVNLTVQGSSALLCFFGVMNAPPIEDRVLFGYAPYLKILFRTTIVSNAP